MVCFIKFFLKKTRRINFYKLIKFTKIFIKPITLFFSFIKFIYNRYLNIMNILFLRKTRTFVKSKYSRTRQWAKTIVYFGLWYNLFSIFYIFLFCYKFLFVFSYLWWFGGFLIILILFKNFFKNFFFFKNYFNFKYF